MATNPCRTITFVLPSFKTISLRANHPFVLEEAKFSFDVCSLSATSDFIKTHLLVMWLSASVN